MSVNLGELKRETLLTFHDSAHSASCFRSVFQTACRVSKIPGWNSPKGPAPVGFLTLAYAGCLAVSDFW